MMLPFIFFLCEITFAIKHIRFNQVYSLYLCEKMCVSRLYSYWDNSVLIVIEKNNVLFMEILKCNIIKWNIIRLLHNCCPEWSTA